jgi:SAM-dependent methyltransferase
MILPTLSAEGNAMAEQKLLSSHYSNVFADHYDSWFGTSSETADTVELLAQLAGSGPVLELGIGTGRIALPLQARGVEVIGIDGSEAMVAQLRSKPGGQHIPVTIGDFSQVPVEGSFSLIYLAAGTFFELPSQQAQLDCFTNATRRLAPDGLFVFDANLPETLFATQSTNGQALATDGDQLIVRYRQLDPAAQRYTSHYVIIDDGATRHLKVAFRYAAPGELDLMAHLAGLRLKERLGGWSGTQFTRSSAYHVSVYEADAAKPSGVQARSVSMR